MIYSVAAPSTGCSSSKGESSIFPWFGHYLTVCLSAEKCFFLVRCSSDQKILACAFSVFLKSVKINCTLNNVTWQSYIYLGPLLLFSFWKLKAKVTTIKVLFAKKGGRVRDFSPSLNFFVINRKLKMNLYNFFTFHFRVLSMSYKSLPIPWPLECYS